MCRSSGMTGRPQNAAIRDRRLPSGCRRRRQTDGRDGSAYLHEDRGHSATTAKGPTGGEAQDRGRGDGGTRRAGGAPDAGSAGRHGGILARGSARRRPPTSVTTWSKPSRSSRRASHCRRHDRLGVVHAAPPARQPRPDRHSSADPDRPPVRAWQIGRTGLVGPALAGSHPRPRRRATWPLVVDPPVDRRHGEREPAAGRRHGPDPDKARPGLSEDTRPTCPGRVAAGHRRRHHGVDRRRRRLRTRARASSWSPPAPCSTTRPTGWAPTASTNADAAPVQPAGPLGRQPRRPRREPRREGAVHRGR